MKTLTVEEAMAGLDHWVDRALAGESVQIRKGDAVVELRPAALPAREVTSELTPREALRRLQQESRLTPQLAEQYLQDVRSERAAAEGRCSR